MLEWEGWSFARRDFWNTVDDQQRTEFISGAGTIAVVDPDEYDDLGNGLGDGGRYNSALNTAPIDVTPFNDGATTLTLEFDSSWRAEGDQAAGFFFQFDGAAFDAVPGGIWDSDGSTIGAKPDATDERLSFDIAVPSGASELTLQFGMWNAGNNWWWAIDNLALSEGGNPAFWTEDFEGATLGDSVNERQITVPAHITTEQATEGTNPRPDSFSNAAPNGWSVDNSGLPEGTVGNNDIGVYEFEGWNFADLDFWTFADGQGRGDFTKSRGTLCDR